MKKFLSFVLRLVISLVAIAGLVYFMRGKFVEAIEVLRGNEKNHEFSSSDLKELTVQLCAHMLELGALAKNLTEGRKLAHKKLSDGSAWRVFQEMVEAQGGMREQILDPRKLPHTSRTLVWKAQKRGYIASMDTEALGRILVEMGGGRKKMTDSVDPRVGLAFHKKLGAAVRPGDPLVTVYAPEKTDWPALESVFRHAIQIQGSRKPVPKLILEVY